MPKYFSNVRPTTPAANRPAFPLGIPPILPVQEPEGYPEAPYPGDLTVNDGASRSFRPTPKTSGYSTNVPMPDNKGPVRSHPDGKDGMAG